MQRLLTNTVKFIEGQKNNLDKINEPKKCVLLATKGKETIYVSWELNIPATDTDWIGFYRKEKPDNKYELEFKTSKSSVDHRNIKIPKEPGFYEFRFFSRGTYDSIATSSIIYVGPKIEMQASMDNFDNITISWNTVEGDIGSGDWIGLYKTDDIKNKNYIRSFWVTKKIDSRESDGHLDSGTYEFRYFPNRCYHYIVKSNPVHITNRDRLELIYTKGEKNRINSKIKVLHEVHSSRISSRDWIAIYKKRKP